MARGRREGVRGSVRRLKSGRWQARLPKDLDPWTRPLGDRFDTREEAVVELRRTVIDIEAGRLLLEDPTAPQEPGTAKPDGYRPETVSDMLENFLVENVDIATNTRSRYRSIIRRVICHPEHGVGDRAVSTLTSGELIRWRRELPQLGFSKHNIKAAWAVLRSALSWEVESDRLESNPAVGMTTRRTKKSRAEETADPVLLPTWQDLHEMASAIPGHQERLLFCLYAYTGARASELMAVEPGDLLPATHEIQLRHTWVKEEGGEWIREPLKSGERRKLLVPAGLWVHLATFAGAWVPPVKRDRIPTLFTPSIPYRRGPGIWTPASWRTVVMLKMRATTGLPYRTKDLRAYAASALVDVGATHEEAQRLLGHSTSDTTSKYYLRAQDLKAHDPARTALRFDPSLTLPERLDALWDAWTNRFDDPMVG